MEDKIDDAFEKELRIGFLEEAGQLLADAEQCFLMLEVNPSEIATLEKIFRLAHNIKGSSKAVGFDALGAFTHEFESFLLKCKSGELAISKASVSLLLKCNDHLNQFVNKLKVDQTATLESASLVEELKNFREVPPTSEAVRSESMQVAENPTPFNPLAPDLPDLNDLAMVVQQSLKELPFNVTQAIQPVASAPAADESIRVSLNRLEKLLNFVGELVILQTVLKEQSYGDNPQLLRRTIQQMWKVTKEIQELSMSLRMIPLKQTFQKMQRIVRDTSSQLGKKVNLILEGEETEVDKTVLETLSDPLVHLVRNAVDHGIEDPKTRLENGKPEMGTIVLRAYHKSGKLIIEVRDNGGGIPADHLRQKALEKGILKPGQVISDQEAVHLIFHPGFSTKAQVTEVSGRGVGMDVVKTNIEQIHGEVLVETNFKQGSIFKVVLPLTLAIIDGMVVRCGEDRFIIPLTHVHESLKPLEKDLQFATGLGEVLHLRGENLPVIRISKILGKNNKSGIHTEQIAVIVRSQGLPFAAFVDDIIGQHQVVIKKLGSEIQNITGYSGSAILGDGKPALILELGELAAKHTKNRQVAV